ncbi:MAG: hypothetical protein NT154_25650 [Verrucomicrobia bacterium]|nr:hypothetical protein [Verrucomicrobiota bacterium]
MIDDQSQIPTDDQPPKPLADTTFVEIQPDQAKGVSYRVQVLLGFGTFFCFLALAIGVIVAVSTESFWALLPKAVILIALGVFTKRRLRWRGFVMGALIGLGLLALAGGLCVAIIRGS